MTPNAAVKLEERARALGWQVRVSAVEGEWGGVARQSCVVWGRRGTRRFVNQWLRATGEWKRESGYTWERPDGAGKVYPLRVSADDLAGYLDAETLGGESA